MGTWAPVFSTSTVLIIDSVTHCWSLRSIFNMADCACLPVLALAFFKNVCIDDFFDFGELGFRYKVDGGLVTTSCSVGHDVYIKS